VNVVYRHIEGTWLKGPHGVFVEPQSGEIYVADTANGLVAVFDRDGLPLFSFGFNREFQEPRKAIADRQGLVYVLGGLPATVKVFSSWGEYLRDFPFESAGLGKPVTVTAIAVDRAGNLYFGDSAGKQVLVYDSDHRLRLRFSGGRGEGFSVVSAIAVAESGEIYVVDSRGVPVVQVYSPEGKFLRGWGEHASGPQNFSLPTGIALANDRVIVVDTLRHTISTFTPSGTFLRRDGGFGAWPGAVAFPTDIASDADGRLYVVDRVGNRLQVLALDAEAGRRADRERGGAVRQGPDDSREQVRARAQVKEVIQGMRPN
jgi:DNA-binding beta-propeller fold protein YncE